MADERDRVDLLRRLYGMHNRLAIDEALPCFTEDAAGMRMFCSESLAGEAAGLGTTTERKKEADRT